MSPWPRSSRPWASRPLQPVEVAGWLGVYAALCVLVGALAGAVWYWVVKLPGYRVGNDFYARIDEWDEAQVFSADVWLAGLGIAAGALLGGLAWLGFRRLGWPTAIIAALGGLSSGIIAEKVGEFLGPSEFDERLANAQPGDPLVVPIDLASHTLVYLAVWVAAAVLPVLIGAAVATTNDKVGWHRLEGAED